MDTPATGDLSRRRFGKAVVLGGSAAGIAAVAGPLDSANAAGTGDWHVTGNRNTNGTNFIGTTNGAPLIIKTNDVERARFKNTGQFEVPGLAAFGTTATTTAQLRAATTSASGTGVRGESPNSVSSALGAMGVQGLGTVGVQGTGDYMGVQGTSLNYGVFGYTNPDTGGIGTYGRGGTGVKGRSYAGMAVLGDTDSGIGVKGESYSDGASVKAVYGQGFGASNNGVVGESSNGTSAYGVWGISTGGYAGVFSGKVLVTGTLSKGAGSFKIDHPLDPENKYLYHSFVESPDMMNVYNGNVRTNATGRATVKLPNYFMALNRDYRYQLTVVGDFAQAVVSKEVADGKFEIKTDKPRVKVSWQVTGIRQDAFANANRIPVSVRKPANERGKYLHPVAYGKSAERDVQHEKLAGVRSRATRQPDPLSAH